MHLCDIFHLMVDTDKFPDGLKDQSPSRAVAAEVLAMCSLCSTSERTYIASGNQTLQWEIPHLEIYIYIHLYIYICMVHPVMLVPSHHLAPSALMLGVPIAPRGINVKIA